MSQGYTDRQVSNTAEFNKKIDKIEKRKKELSYKHSIHEFFGLSYANYLVIPRSILQSMPEEWQGNFVELIRELDKAFEWRREGCWVTFKNNKGRYMHDCFNDYKRGRLDYSPEQVKKLKNKHEKEYEVK